MKDGDLIKINKVVYRVEEKLGEGSFKKAYKIMNVQTKEYYVMFEAVSETGKKIKHFNSEIDSMKKVMIKFQNRCIPRVICPIFLRKYGEKRGKTGVIITNYFKGVELRSYLQQHNLSFEDAVIIIMNVFDVIYLLHSNGVAHMDLKPENMIIDPKTLEINIIDLGLSCFDKDRKCVFGGTMAYLAQELILLKAISRTIEQFPSINIYKLDIWSFGCITFEILSGRQFYDILGRHVQNFRDISLHNEKLDGVVELIKIKHIKTIESRNDLLPKTKKVNEEVLQDLLYVMKGCLQPVGARMSTQQIQTKMDEIKTKFATNF